MFISNWPWQSENAMLASCSSSCFPLACSVPVVPWLDQSMNKHHTPGTAGLCIQSGDWGRARCKYCLNNFSHYIPLGSAFPRARFVPECQDEGKEFVWLAAARWKKKRGEVLKSFWQIPYGSWVCGNIIWMFCACVCIVSGLHGVHMYEQLLLL